MPWRGLAWIALFWIGLLLVPAAEDLFGSLAAYGLLLATMALGGWRLDRWVSRQYWRGLKDYQS